MRKLFKPNCCRNAKMNTGCVNVYLYKNKGFLIKIKKIVRKQHLKYQILTTCKNSHKSMID